MNRKWFVVWAGLGMLLLLAGCGQQPEDKLIAHRQEIGTIIQDNMDDPDTVIARVREYNSEHKDDIEQAGRELQEKLQGMDFEEMMEYMVEVGTKINEEAGNMQQALLQFTTRCPEKALELMQATQSVQIQ